LRSNSLLADNEAVKQQSAIVAGTGGFNIVVNGHTQLVGAAVASKAEAWRNSFSTQSLVHEDVANRDAVAGKSSSVGVSRSASAAGATGGGSSIGFARIDSNQTSNTRSSVAGAVTITRPDLQASRVVALRSAERDPLVTVRSQRQEYLNWLLWNEPPQCDGYYYYCNINAAPPAVLGGAAAPAAGKGATTVSAAAATTAASTATTPSAPKGAGAANNTSSSSEWYAWRAAVQATESEIAALNGRIAAVDNKVYQSTATLSESASGLHTPLLHTFDKGKATQELKDGVAVTAAFWQGGL
jgi:hypothetical protein